jgi:hypothetical protein
MACCWAGKQVVLVKSELGAVAGESVCEDRQVLVIHLRTFIKVNTLMEASDDWDSFYRMLNKVLPPYSTLPLLALAEEDIPDESARRSNLGRRAIQLKGPVQ